MYLNTKCFYVSYYPRLGTVSQCHALGLSVGMSVGLSVCVSSHRSRRRHEAAAASHIRPSPSQLYIT